MGLAQLMERPRNWITQSQAFNDALAVGDNGDFFGFAEPQVAGLEVNRGFRFPYDTVIERWWVTGGTNSLDALSTNTITLRINLSDTTSILTLTDTIPVTNVLFESTGLGLEAAAGNLISWRWNSDSAGTWSMKQFGISYRIVNPTA